MLHWHNLKLVHGKGITFKLYRNILEEGGSRYVMHNLFFFVKKTQFMNQRPLLSASVKSQIQICCRALDWQLTRVVADCLQFWSCLTKSFWFIGWDQKWGELGPRAGPTETLGQCSGINWMMQTITWLLSEPRRKT